MAWQISVVNAIINNSTLPLEGVILAHLAAYLEPSQPGFEVFCQKIRSWALPVTLGFLLIIPLQSYNLAKGLSNYYQSTANFERNVGQGFQKLRDAVSSAPTVGDLQQRLVALKGPALSPADTRLPLPLLRQNLLVIIQRAEMSARANSNVGNPDQIWAFAKDMVRSILTAAVFALAFSAAAKRTTWQDSLLVRFGESLKSFRATGSKGTGKIFADLKAKQQAALEKRQVATRLRQHSMEVRRAQKQEEKEQRMRARNLERMRPKPRKRRRDTK